MDFKTAMSELEKAGTAQNVKVYTKHGAGGDMFGVSFANLRTLAKKIKNDQELAEQLWNTANVDAQSLAAMIADPERMKQKTLESWVGDTSYYVIADLLGSLTAKTPYAFKAMKKFCAQSREYVRQVGYAALSSMLVAGHDDISDDDCRTYLSVIESEIHSSPNRAKHAMNMTLTAIGIFRASLTDAALETAARIGKVTVDHGDTSCKTPDAAAYIRKALKRKKSAARR